MQDADEPGRPEPLAPRLAASSPVRLTEMVRSALHQQISSGQYPRRTRLPSERELAAEFNVSRPVVRVALAHLRSDGLVESISRFGFLCGSW